MLAFGVSVAVYFVTVKDKISALTERFAGIEEQLKLQTQILQTLAVHEERQASLSQRVLALERSTSNGSGFRPY
jgi:hypothetical protein